MSAVRPTPAALLIGAASIAVFIVAPFILARYGLYILSLWAVMTIGALGLNLTLGYAGQISLAQGAFVGIGAYTTALMTTNGMPLTAAFAVAVILCFIVGWLLGYPALRVQHHYLAFITLAFATLCTLAFRNEEWLTKGVSGISSIPRPGLFGISAKSPLAYYFFCLFILALVTGALYYLIASPWGRAFTALRENPLRAQSLGIDTRRYTLMAFAIGSVVGGVCGAVYAPLVEFIEPPQFTLGLSLSLLMMVIVGGAGFFAGPFLGALISVLLPEWLRFMQGYYLILYALLVMGLMIYSPTGILGIIERWRSDRKTRAASALRAAASAVMQPAAAPEAGQ